MEKPLTHIIEISDTLRAAGRTWYLDHSARPCWVDGRATVAYDFQEPQPGIELLMKRVFDHGDSLGFSDWVALENQLLTASPYQALPDSGLMRFRRLQVVKRAASLVNVGNPLAKSWMLSHRDVLRWNEFGGNYEPDAKPYWDLYERNKSRPWADELAWAGAQIMPDADECMSDCMLGQIIDGPFQYWNRLPRGRFARPALALATAMAKAAVKMACSDGAQTPHANSDSPFPADVVAQLRRSLVPVRDSARAGLLTLLADGEAKCK